MGNQLKIPCTIMRGGTSKGVILQTKDIPADLEERNRLMLAIFGSPDVRQIDGLGGADLLTSKCAIVEPSDREDADVNYTFAQVGIAKAEVSYDINCGNMITAVGLFAVEEGWLPVTEPFTNVRVYNSNTDKVMTIKVPVEDGMPLIEGECEIDGVPGTSAEIALDYSKTLGSATGQLFPSGQVMDLLYVPSLNKEIPVTLIDLGNLSVFFNAVDIGLRGTESPSEFTAQQIELFEEIRIVSSKLCGMDGNNQMIPYQIMVSPPEDYNTLSGARVITKDEIDFVSRMGTLKSIHKAYPVGGATCAAVAAHVPGTVVYQVSASKTSPGTIRIGHPSGIMDVYSDINISEVGYTVNEVLFSRTARRIMDGHVYVRKDRI